MSMRYQAGILTASYFPLKVPNAPTAVTATMASSTSVSVAFTAPADVGGGAITGYTVVSSGGHIATGSSSPITVSGLTTGVAYTFVVYANNAFGNSPASAASNSVTPVAQGQQAYTTAGTYSWVAPAGVTSVSVVAVGGGGPRGGGGLGYKNNISVTPGNSYTVVAGAGGSATFSTLGGDSYFISTATVKGGGAINSSGFDGGNFTGDGGGNGGNGSFSGGGAGGYAGNGGNTNAAAQTGGGGGGGGGFDGTGNNGYGGGGVGLLGIGATGGINQGGSGGGNSNFTSSVRGGLYGGGGSYGVNYSNGSGANGAVRIIWPGNTRSFPSTNTGNL